MNRKLYIARPDENWEPNPDIRETMNIVKLLLADYEGVIDFFKEVGYRERPDSSATSTREILEEFLVDVLYLYGVDKYTGHIKYELKRMFASDHAKEKLPHYAERKNDTHEKGQAD